MLFQLNSFSGVCSCQVRSQSIPFLPYRLADWVLPWNTRPFRRQNGRIWSRAAGSRRGLYGKQCCCLWAGFLGVLRLFGPARVARMKGASGFESSVLWWQFFGSVFQEQKRGGETCPSEVPTQKDDSFRLNDWWRLPLQISLRLNRSRALPCAQSSSSSTQKDGPSLSSVAWTVARHATFCQRSNCKCIWGFSAAQQTPRNTYGSTLAWPT